MKKLIIYLYLTFILILVAGCSSISINTSDPGYNIKRNLAEEGYEVTDVGITNENEAFVKMTSFGDAESQIMSAIMNLALWYPNAEKYGVQLENCHYGVNGLNYRNYLNELDKKNYSDEFLAFSYNLRKQILSSKSCFLGI